MMGEASHYYFTTIWLDHPRLEPHIPYTIHTTYQTVHSPELILIGVEIADRATE